MSRLDIIYLDFWVGMLAQAGVFLIYTMQARRLRWRWNLNRTFLLLLTVVVVPWFILGITSHRVPDDVTHLVFFTGVAVVLLFELAMVVIITVRQRAALRRVEQARKDHKVEGP